MDDIEVDDDIQVVSVESTNGTSKPPLILNSRLSADFKEYLNKIETSFKLFPNVFSEKDWFKATKINPYVIGTSPADLKQIWIQVYELAVKYKSSCIQTWMIYRYYLNGLVLKAKLKSIETYMKQDIDIPWPTALPKLNGATDTIKYSLFIVEEILQQYLQLEYELTSAGDIRVSNSVPSSPQVGEFRVSSGPSNPFNPSKS